MEELVQIVGIQLRRLQAQLAEAGIKVRVTEEAKRHLAQEGFDPAYGARPLKRVIQQRLANRLASALLSQTIPENSEVEIGWDGSDFTFTPVPAGQPAAV